MSIPKLAALSAAAAFAAIGFASPASAQATRTWVSGVGDDVNPCSRTAPCKTFAGAISKTAAGGEINCLDAGGFGAVTITKSLVIDCHFTEGGTLAGGNGITVNAASTDVVVIRGLDIFGVSPPSNGVRIVNASAVHIEDCTIRRFNAAGSFGISFVSASTRTHLYVSNTTITENGSGTGGGILVQPTGAATARMHLENVQIKNNVNGIVVDLTGSTGFGVGTVVDRSVITGNTGNAISVNVPVSESILLLRDSVVDHNAGSGLTASGAATVRVTNSAFYNNSYSSGFAVVATNGASIISYGDNILANNSNNGAFTSVVTKN